MACIEERDRANKRDAYKEAKRTVKRTLAKAKGKYKNFYTAGYIKEKHKCIFKLAKARFNKKQDLYTLKYIKDEDGRVLFK